ncbi:MAG: hypothetical protein US89_C0013G0039 [Candidatus Peregrinibacteria bacterium GW2011_GWF2_38_29]|nr:MAG: hypothetical protein US89_C0013G0039 [Candidatus Peregrinibacteria bacterium GW2011_GWF2_38_29]
MEDSTQTTTTTVPAITPAITPEIVPVATPMAPVSVAPTQMPAAAPVATPIVTQAPASITPETPSAVPTSKHVSTLGVMAIVLVLIAAGTGGYFASKYLKANMNSGEEAQVQVESTVLQDTNIIDQSLEVPPATVEEKMPEAQTEVQNTTDTESTAETAKVKRK